MPPAANGSGAVPSIPEEEGEEAARVPADAAARPCWLTSGSAGGRRGRSAAAEATSPVAAADSRAAAAAPPASGGARSSGGSGAGLVVGAAGDVADDEDDRGDDDGACAEGEGKDVPVALSQCTRGQQQQQQMGGLLSLRNSIAVSNVSVPGGLGQQAFVVVVRSSSSRCLTRRCGVLRAGQQQQPQQHCSSSVAAGMGMDGLTAAGTGLGAPQQHPGHARHRSARTIAKKMLHRSFMANPAIVS